LKKRRQTSKTRTVKTEQEHSFVGFSQTKTEKNLKKYIREYEKQFFHTENK